MARTHQQLVDLLPVFDVYSIPLVVENWTCFFRPDVAKTTQESFDLLLLARWKSFWLLLSMCCWRGRAVKERSRHITSLISSYLISS